MQRVLKQSMVCLLMLLLGAVVAVAESPEVPMPSPEAPTLTDTAEATTDPAACPSIADPLQLFPETLTTVGSCPESDCFDDSDCQELCPNSNAYCGSDGTCHGGSTSGGGGQGGGTCYADCTSNADCVENCGSGFFCFGGLCQS